MSWFHGQKVVTQAGARSHDRSVLVSSCLRRIQIRQRHCKRWLRNQSITPHAISVRWMSQSTNHCSSDRCNNQMRHSSLQHRQQRNHEQSTDNSRWSAPPHHFSSSVASILDANDDESVRDPNTCSFQWTKQQTNRNTSSMMHQQLRLVHQWWGKQGSGDISGFGTDKRNSELFEQDKASFRRRKRKRSNHLSANTNSLRSLSMYHRRSIVSTQRNTYLGTSILLSTHPYSGTPSPQQPSSSSSKSSSGNTSSSKNQSSKSTKSNSGGKSSSVTSNDSSNSNSSVSSSSNQSWTKWLNPIFTAKKLGNMIYRISYLLVDSIIHPAKGMERLRNGWKHFLEELKHYWASTKLLASDVRVAARIVRKMLRGYELSYRERRHLRRTALDMLRMIPFAFFIIIPFLEFLLPVVLIMFPGLLPSTFRTKFQKAEARKRQLQLRLDLAKFMQETLTEFTDSLKKSKSDGDVVEKLSDIVDKVRLGQEVSNDEILKVSSLFDDHITLDNATNTELKNLCQYMGLSAFGPPALLRMRLHTRIRELRLEDRGIRKEGIDKIPEQLLKQLVRERGMRADLPEELLRENLNKWVQLSLDYRVPTSLLFISRVFTIQHVPGEEVTTLLKKKLEVASETAYDEVLVEKAGVIDSAKEKAVLDRQTKLMQEEELVNREQELAQKATEQALEDVDAQAAAKGVRSKDESLASASSSSSSAAKSKSQEKTTKVVSETGVIDEAEVAYKDQRKLVEQSMSEAQAALGRDAQTKSMEEQAAYKKKLLGTAEKLQAMMSESAVEHEQFELKHLMNKVKDAAHKLEDDAAAHVLADGNSNNTADQTVEMDGDIAKELGSAFESSSDSTSDSTTTMVDMDGNVIQDSAETIADDDDDEYDEEQAQREREHKEYEKAQKTKDKLSSKLESMLGKLDSDIVATKSAIGNTMRVFESGASVTYNEVGKVIREQMEQLDFSDEELDRVLHDLDLKGDDKLSKQEIDDVCRMLRRELAVASDDDTDTDIEEDDDADSNGSGKQQIRSFSSSHASSSGSSSSS